MIRKNKWQLIISSVIILLPVVAGLLIWNYLPEQLAAHWSTDGRPDRWSSKGFTVFVMPISLLVIHWICIFITARDPKNENQSDKIFNLVLWILPILSLIICGFTYAIALGIDINISMMMRVLLGVMFVVLGNYMPKCRQNYTIGIRVVWALHNEENWNKTHRFTGKLWVSGGFLFLATFFVTAESFMYIVLLLILSMAFIPVIYSYAYYRKQLKTGSAAKEDIVLSASEKKTTKIALIISIATLAIVAIALFAGKFEVKFQETSFVIEAAGWDDAAVNYADIDHIEYREQRTSGIRTFGYGTPFIVMGECENKEFGNYIGYIYKSCDACVVLTVGDKILVINGKDEEHTKEIYDELIRRMSR